MLRKVVKTTIRRARSVDSSNVRVSESAVKLTSVLLIIMLFAALTIAIGMAASDTQNHLPFKLSQNSAISESSASNEPHELLNESDHPDGDPVLEIPKIFHLPQEKRLEQIQAKQGKERRHIQLIQEMRARRQARAASAARDDAKRSSILQCFLCILVLMLIGVLGLCLDLIKDYLLFEYAVSQNEKAAAAKMASNEKAKKVKQRTPDIDRGVDGAFDDDDDDEDADLDPAPLCDKKRATEKEVKLLHMMPPLKSDKGTKNKKELAIEKAEVKKMEAKTKVAVPKVRQRSRRRCASKKEVAKGKAEVKKMVEAKNKVAVPKRGQRSRRRRR